MAKSVLEWLEEVGNRNHRDMFAATMVGHTHAMNQAQLRNGKRQEAQVDALLRCKHGDNYKPPEDDDMGVSLINCPIVGDEALKLISESLAKSEASATATSTEKPDPSTAAPTAALPHAPTGSGFFISLLKTMLPLLLTAGVSIAAAKYFAPEAPTDIYDIEAMPYVPPEIQ